MRVFEKFISYWFTVHNWPNMSDMKYRRLGDSSLNVSVLGYGANNLGRKGSASEDIAGAKKVVDAALDVGVTYFDTANVYGHEPGLSETLLGKALGNRRDDIVIATKFGLPVAGEPKELARGSRRYIMKQCEASLRRLGTDWIDLYYYHSPDSLTPITETIDALDNLVDQGKIRYYGVSNTTGWQLADAWHNSRPGRLVATQNHYNLLDRRAEQEIVPAAQHFGLGLVPYYPLAAGILTGKYTQSVPQDARLKPGDPKLAAANFDALRAYQDFCSQRDTRQASVAIAWLASQSPVASIIAGATRPEQIRKNAQAVELELSMDDLATLDEIFPRPEKVALF